MYKYVNSFTVGDNSEYYITALSSQSRFSFKALFSLALYRFCTLTRRRVIDA